MSGAPTNAGGSPCYAAGGGIRLAGLIGVTADDYALIAIAGVWMEPGVGRFRPPAYNPGSFVEDRQARSHESRGLTMKKLRLFTPGPTMVPEEVLLEMARPMEHHRTAFYRDIMP